MNAHQLETRAADVLTQVPGYVWDGESLPVPVEEIATSCFRLFIREVDDMTAAPGCPPIGEDQSISGLLLASSSEIWVNASEAKAWPSRKRFTIGHELGHWVLHGTDRDAVFCRHASVDAPEASADSPNVPWLEWQANVFAAALLMPAELVRRHYSRLRDRRKMAELFGTSGAAMGRRLYALT